MENQNEKPRFICQNYSKIWNFDLVLYAVEGKKLIFPLNMRIASIALVCFMVFFVIGKLLPFIPGGYTYVVFPSLLTWFIAKQKLDGKPPHKWLMSMIFFLMRNKVLRRYQKMQYNNHYVYKSKIMYRTHRERM
ncbi:conjugal transfer protein [Paenibacillus peoriae]|uniref:conjugal transfer protein n=1 Tax=Paenibacillus peoriae TaxID=59893 RepID=UPI000F9DDB89|nr:conjugal transfer protein [Paenibacillus peoriae]